MANSTYLIYEMLNNLGLHNYGDVHKFLKKVDYHDFLVIHDQVVDIYQNLEDELNQIKLLKNLFKVVPAGSLNLDAVNVCAAPTCRLKALESACKNLLLYTDLLIMKDPIFNSLSVIVDDYAIVKKTDEVMRDFAQGLYSLIFVRPLVENDMLRMIPDRNQWWNLCPKCRKRLLSEAKIDFEKGLNIFSELASVTVSKDPILNYDLRISHPDYRDHALSFDVEHIPKSLENKLHRVPISSLPTYKLTKSEMRKFDVIKANLFSIHMQLLWGASVAEQTNSSVLTDSITQWKLVEENRGLHKSLDYGLSFEIPYIEEIGIADLLAIRKSEPVSFENLRLSLAEIRKVCSEGERGFEKDLRYYLIEKLIPEINIVEEDLRAIKRRTRIKTISTAALGGILGLIGFYEGSFSPSLISALQQFGFLALALKGIHICSEHFEKLDEIRSKAPYFLWKVKHGRISEERGSKKGK